MYHEETVSRVVQTRTSIKFHDACSEIAESDRGTSIRSTSLQ